MTSTSLKAENLTELNYKKYLTGFLKCIRDGFGSTCTDYEKASNILFDKMMSGDTIIILISEDEVVATATCVKEHKFIHEGSLIFHIEEVCVKKEHRGKGYGKIVMDETIKLARSSGAYKVVLSCSDENVSFYEKCGFRQNENYMRFDVK